MGYISANKTKITGALLVAFGFVQTQSETLRALLTPERFAWVTMGIGLAVAVLGFLNSGGSITPPGESKTSSSTTLRSLLLVLFMLPLVTMALPGCTGTRDAYKAAVTTTSAPVAEATAYVVGEQYAALVAEAAALKNAGTLTGAKLEAVRKADDAVKPLIIGNPATGRPGLRQAVDAYKAVKSAATLADLQAATDAAVVELSKLIDALKAGKVLR